MSQREQEIWQACDDLLAMGKKPQQITGAAIGNRLQELGYKPGSLTYRFKYRNSWMAAQGFSRVEAIIGKPSKRIQHSATLLPLSIKDDAQKHYEKKYQGVTEGMTALTEKRHEAQQRQEVYHSEQTASRQTIQQLEQALQKATADLSELQKELAVIHAQTAEREKCTENKRVAHTHALSAINQQFEARETQYKESISNFLEINEKQRHEFMLHHNQLQTENTKHLQALAKSEEREALMKKQVEEKEQQLYKLQQISITCHENEQHIAALIADNQRLERLLKEVQRDAHQIQLGRLKATAEAAHCQTELKLLKQRIAKKGPPDEV